LAHLNWKRPTVYMQKVFRRGYEATAARSRIEERPSMKLKIDRAHYLWGCFHLLWSLFIYGLGVCSEMVLPCGTENRIAHTSSVIRPRMDCCCVIRHVRCAVQPRLRAYDVFRRCLSDVELSHGSPRARAGMTRNQTPLHCG
jgi:hypothetical protein